MRVIKVAILAFVLGCVVFSGPAEGVEITPSDTTPLLESGTNRLVLDSAGDIFSFDFVISDPGGFTATSFGSLISVSGPGTLTLDATESEDVASDTGYWIYGNSDGAFANDQGGNIYEFGDSVKGEPPNPIAELLIAGDIMARYAFTWDGTVGNYIFTIDLDSPYTYIADEDYIEHSLQFTPGRYEGHSNGPGSFTINIVPEPTTLILIGMGGLVLLRKRRAQS